MPGVWKNNPVGRVAVREVLGWGGMNEWAIDKLQEVKATACREEVLSLLNQNKRSEATELLVNAIKGNVRLYTIRDDNNPEMWAYDNGIYIPNGECKVKTLLRDILGENYTTHLSNLVIEKIKADTYIGFDFFNWEPKDEIAVENGILNLTTHELTPFTPDKIFFAKIPVKFDKTKDCPMIKVHLNEVLNNSVQDVQVMQEVIGWCLTKEYKPEKAIMLIGDGRNGKGKTIEACFRRFLGAENCTNVALQNLEDKDFFVSELHHKHANLMTDLDKRALRNTGLFKQATGGDLLLGNRKFKVPVPFVNYAKFIALANQIPMTYDDTMAFFNRWIVLEFPFTFVEKEELSKTPKSNFKQRDPNVVEKISTPEEMSGLLNWALEGLDRLRKNGEFSYSKTTDEVRKAWIAKSNSLLSFIQDRVEKDVTAEPISKEDFREAYIEYCVEKDLIPISEKSSANFISRAGATSCQISRTEPDKEYPTRMWAWKGIKVKRGQQKVC